MTQQGNSNKHPMESKRRPGNADTGERRNWKERKKETRGVTKVRDPTLEGMGNFGQRRNKHHELTDGSEERARAAHRRAPALALPRPRPPQQQQQLPRYPLPTPRPAGASISQPGKPADRRSPPASRPGYGREKGPEHALLYSHGAQIPCPSGSVSQRSRARSPSKVAAKPSIQCNSHDRRPAHGATRLHVVNFNVGRCALDDAPRPCTHACAKKETSRRVQSLYFSKVPFRRTAARRVRLQRPNAAC
ncbi:hypothetical protein HDK77DRAFT_238141 [Phyllosticta capitalensis]